MPTTKQLISFVCWLSVLGYNNLRLLQLQTAVEHKGKKQSASITSEKVVIFSVLSVQYVSVITLFPAPSQVLSFSTILSGHHCGTWVDLIAIALTI